jgi:acyl-CoA synthetase (AMP-forming)/AMP-acid ligase II
VVNLTTVSSRPLHAVLLPPEATAGPLLSALSAALDGTGPAILPLDPAQPPERLRALLDAFAPSAVQTPEGTQPLAPPVSAGSAPPGGPAGVPAEVAVVIATSGSTGQPKGVQLSAAALRASAASSLARIGAGPGQRWLCCLPGFHVAGVQVLVRSLLAGADPVVATRADPAIVADAVAAGCAHVSLVPTQLRRLLDGGPAGTAALAALGSILLGGAAPPPGLLAEAAAAGARVITTYGMSETCGGCVYDGYPLDGVRVAIGDGGLIQIAGPVLFSGYQPAGLPAGRLPDGQAGNWPGPEPAGGWFITSDLGSLDASGRLTVRGRADDIINTGGEKVLPGEVESVLGTISGVRDVVVVGVPDPEWGELVTAVVVPADPAAPPELGALRAHARDRLPGHAAPRRLVLTAEIPMLASGKPDRQALRRAASATGNPGT